MQLQRTLGLLRALALTLCIFFLPCCALAQPAALAAELQAAARAGSATALAALLPAPAQALAPALTAALAGWRAAHAAAAWPPPRAAQWAEAFTALLSAGAALPPAEACTPLFDALAFRDAPALAALLAALPPAQLAQCLAARRGAGGGTLLHHASRAPAPRASVALFRLRREGNSSQAAALAQALGLAGGAPAWEAGAGGAAQRLSAGALERAVGVPELGPLGRALDRAPASSSSAALTASDAAGATPLHTACAEGRSRTAQWLLARAARHAPATPAAAALAAAARRHCAHAAAARGDAALLQALWAAPGAQEALAALDAQGRTPCELALRLGALGASAVGVLRSAGACSGVGAAIASSGSSSTTSESEVVSAPRCPRGHDSASARGPLDVPACFSACSHASAGWRLASPTLLHSVGLPGRLLACNSSAAQAQQRVRQGHGLASGAWCPIDVLQPSALAPAARQAVLRSYLQYGRPFLVSGAFDPSTGALCGEAGGPSPAHGAPPPPSAPPGIACGSSSGSVHELTRSALLAEAGSARVSFGAVPLEAAYNSSSSSSSRVRRVSLAEFVGAHMGAPDAGSPAAGPGASATEPQYVFDTQVLRAARGRGGALGGAAAALHAALVGEAGGAAARQLAVGPPLSGAPPHFHRAAVNTLLAGLKLWAVWPPGEAFFVDGASARQWWAAHLRSNSSGSGSTASATAAHYLFLQGPGDAVYLPPLWGHAVLNLADSVGAALE